MRPRRRFYAQVMAINWLLIGVEMSVGVRSIP